MGMNAAIGEFDEWQNMLTAVCGFFTMSAPTAPFNGHMELGRFGAFDIAGIAANVSKIEKTNRDVSRSDDANLFLILGVEGEAVLEQDGANARLGVGDMCLIDSRRPSEFRYKSGFKQISVHLPEMRTRELFSNRELPLAKILRYQDNALLRECVVNMYERAQTGGAQTGVVLANSPVERAAREEIDRLAQNEDCLHLLRHLVFGDRYNADGNDLSVNQYKRVNQYIEDNLDDPDLNLDKIAAACFITRRSLCRLFERAGLSPFTWIRMRRLERARTDIMNCKDGETCTDIAFAYGFNSSPHFSRVFKNKFGLPPKKLQMQSRVLS
ncbi:MAG: hypothetical protein COA91_00130 [Robiginitomaculum sp.]|nr:MAG: hypothetical protein COA91_00130 [Robiginitomaculum sp.]